MAVQFLDSDQFDWSQLTLRLDGVELTTLQSINISKEVNKIPIYGMNRHFSDVIYGNVTYNGNLSILHSDFQPLLQLGVDVITEVPFLISMILEGNGSFKSYHLTGVHFTNWDLNFEQGANAGIVLLPFIASKLTAINFTNL